jgi:ubiquitin-conjugating enzyme E2 H
VPLKYVGFYDPFRHAEYVQRFATKDVVDATDKGQEDEGDEEMSDMGSISEEEADDS